MNKQQLIDVAESLGIKHYNDNEKYIVLQGVNGHATILYSNHKNNVVVSTMKDFAEHLKQMGRDSLKMDIQDLLSITLHN